MGDAYRIFYNIIRERYANGKTDDPDMLVCHPNGLRPTRAPFCGRVLLSCVDGKADVRTPPQRDPSCATA